jgi:hypothetical protein
MVANVVAEKLDTIPVREGSPMMRFPADGSSDTIELAGGVEERNEGVNEPGVTARGIYRPRHGDSCLPFTLYTWHSRDLDR